MAKTYTVEKKFIPSFGRKIKLLILKPVGVTAGKAPGKAPGILWIHGGGYATGMAEMVYFSRALNLVKKYGAVVVAPSYRLAPKHPYPAALEDCYAALCYLKEHARELGVRSDQIMVGGESAGGGLTAAVCLYARDKGEVNIAYQMPLYPMLDDRDTDSSRDNHAPVWNTKRNRKAWEWYLNGIAAPSAYAAPARAESYAGLPPAYTFVGDIEPFYCETLTYIRRLQEAGVEASVDVYPGCFHAFDMLLPFLKVSKQAAATFEKRFSYAMTHYFAEQPNYRKATFDDLEHLWNRTIAEHPDEPWWLDWKNESFSYNKEGLGATFVVICDGEPVGQGTLLFSSQCRAIGGRTVLADNQTVANINALRIRKEHEGQGHMSTLVRMMERYAAAHGYCALTIGVDARETRNRAIYQHWGYNQLVLTVGEGSQQVLYYRKKLVSTS